MSDESKFTLFGTDSVEWCWRRPSERLDSRFTKKTVKHGGGGKVMVWGCMTWSGLGQLVHIEGKLDRFQCRDILERDFLGSLDDLGLDLRSIIFQQDNDPKHTSKLVQGWLSNNHVETLDWVAQSLDMNPIEHLWHHLGTMVNSCSPPPHNADELWEVLQEEWEKVGLDYVRNLI